MGKDVKNSFTPSNACCIIKWLAFKEKQRKLLQRDGGLLGRYWQTVSDLGLFPMLVGGAVLLVAGIVLSLWGVFSKSDG